MFQVVTYLEAISFLITGATISGLTIMTLVTTVVSHQKGFQLKIFGLQIIRGFGIALVGLLFLFDEVISETTVMQIQVGGFIVADFCNFISYWILTNKYFISAKEMTTFFNGSIFNHEPSFSYVVYWWGVFFGMAGLYALYGYYLYNYLSAEAYVGTFQLLQAFNSILSHYVPSLLIHRTQNQFMMHCVKDPQLEYSFTKNRKFNILKNILIITAGFQTISVAMKDSHTAEEYVLEAILLTLELVTLFLFLGLTVKIGLQYDLKQNLPGNSYMELMRKILSDRDIIVKKDRKLVQRLLEEDDDIRRPKDQLNKNQMNRFEYTRVLFTIFGKKELLLRYIVVENFTDPILSQKDLDRIEELKRQAKALKEKKQKQLAALADDEEQPLDNDDQVDTAIN